MQTIMSRSLYLAIIAGLIALCSCNNKLYYGSPSALGYVPDVANVNLQKEKGDMQNASFVGLNHFENQTSYNVTKNLFVQTNGYFSNYLNFGEGGIGYYKVLPRRQFMTSVVAGYGYGHMDAREKKLSSGSEPMNWSGRTFFYEAKTTYNSSYTNKVFAQANLTWFANEKYSLSVGSRLNLVYMNDYVYREETFEGVSTGWVSSVDVKEQKLVQKRTQILDAHVTVARNCKSFTWYLQALVNVPLKKADQNSSQNMFANSMFPLLSAGMMFNFDLLHKRKGPISTY